MMLLFLLLSLITTSLADCSFRFNGGAYIALHHDPSHFLPAQSSFISFDFWIKPRKFSRSITGGQDTYKYIIQTGIIHDLWSWEIRTQETPFGSILVYEYWERDDSLVWSLKHSYSTGEYTLPDRQWSHVWYSANESITYINYLPVKLVNQNITYSKNDPNQYFQLGDRFTGSMDEVRIWNNAYMGDFKPLSNTTLCPADYVSKSAMYFNFNECSGGEVTELVSNWCATVFHHKMRRNSRPEWDLLSPIVTLPCTKTSKCYAETVPKNGFLMGVEIGEFVVFLIPSIILLCLIGFKLKSCLQAKRNSYTFLKKKQTKRQNQQNEVDHVQISQPVSYQPLEPYQVISPPFYVPPQATFHVYDPNDENVVIVV